MNGFSQWYIHQVGIHLLDPNGIGNLIKSVLMQGGRKIGEPREKKLSEQEENNIFSAYETGIQPGSQSWEATVLRHHNVNVANQLT